MHFLDLMDPIQNEYRLRKYKIREKKTILLYFHYSLLILIMYR